MFDRENLANWFGGCLIQIVALVVLCAFFRNSPDKMDVIITAIAWAVVMSPLALLLRWLMHSADLEGAPWDALLGPVLLAICLALGYIHPFHSEKTGGAGTSPPASGDLGAPPPPISGGSGAAPPSVVDESDLPPGIRYVAPDAETPTLDEALAELDELIGLQSVKEEVHKFASFVRVAQQREAAGLKVAPISYHMVFTGNPGTGKTTVARIMAKIYRALGIVKKGQLVETDRGGLIAEYVGQTAIKTGAVIDAALGGVLFIDEAYAITEGDGRNGYGGECIATLLKRMEDDRDKLVVIVAGYTDEMKRFIDANPGLQSRFNRYIHFPDYTGEELAAIFRMNARKNQYVLSDDVEKWLDSAMRVWTKDRDRKFGNGRYVRNLFEKAVENHAIRVSGIENPTKEQLMTLTMHDIGIKLKDADASDED